MYLNTSNLTVSLRFTKDDKNVQRYLHTVVDPVQTVKRENLVKCRTHILLFKTFFQILKIWLYDIALHESCTKITVIFSCVLHIVFRYVNSNLMINCFTLTIINIISVYTQTLNNVKYKLLCNLQSITQSLTL